MKSGRPRSLPGSLFTFDYKNSLKTELGIYLWNKLTKYVSGNVIVIL